jgi:hypothetical protein
LSALAALTALLLSGRAQGDDVTEGDGVPTGMVAFFLDGTNGLDGDGDAPAACPRGWAPAAEAAGRLIVPVTGTTEVGVAVGSPLMDQEDRKHAHPFSAQLVLPAKPITGADGGNRSGAQAGPVMWTGTTEPAASSLPFIQLLACEKR